MTRYDCQQQQGWNDTRCKIPDFAPTPTSPWIFDNQQPVMIMLRAMRGRERTHRANQFARGAVSSQQWRECNLIRKENVFSSALSDQQDKSCFSCCR